MDTVDTERIQQILREAGFMLQPDRSLLAQLDSVDLIHLVDLLEASYGITIGIFDVTEANFGSLTKLGIYLENRSRRT